MVSIGANELNEFMAYMASERGLALNTRQAYQLDLSQYFEFCARREISPLSVSLDELRMFIASLRKQGLSASTLSRKLSAIKQFYKFCVRENKVTRDPSELLSIQVKTRKLPRLLTVDEMFRLLESAKGENEVEVRDRALLELWYATGARVSEIADLKSSSFDWTGGVVKIFGKGNRERLVPLSQDAMLWCKKYETLRHEWVRRHALAETKVFFLSQQGRGFTRQAIWKLLKRYAKKSGLARNVWPHMIRHSFATHILQGGADLRAVQELLGHKSISTTEVYTHLDIENLKVMQLKYHPRR